MDQSISKASLSRVIMYTKLLLLLLWMGELSAWVPEAVFTETEDRPMSDRYQLTEMNKNVEN